MKIKGTKPWASWNVFSGGQRYRYDPFNLNYKPEQSGSLYKEYYKLKDEYTRYPDQVEVSAEDYIQQPGPKQSHSSSRSSNANKLRSRIVQQIVVMAF